MDKAILRLENLTKAYQKPRTKLFQPKKSFFAVNNVNLEVYKGESLGIVGESGSGKTTIAKMIMDLVHPTSGEIFFESKKFSELDLKGRQEWRRHIQIVFQDPYGSLNPKKTIGWTLQEPLDIHHIGTLKERKEAVLKILEDVGLPGSYIDHLPHELSGGQRQRVAIAAALILKPQILLVDEGVSALDVSIQASILNLLKDLQDLYNLTYIFISHDLNVIQYFCDRVAVLYNGELQEVFQTEDFDKEKHCAYTKKLFASVADPLTKI